VSAVLLFNALDALQIQTVFLVVNNSPQQFYVSVLGCSECGMYGVLEVFAASTTENNLP
jgi:hypothetical protein